MQISEKSKSKYGLVAETVSWLHLLIINGLISTMTMSNSIHELLISSSQVLTQCGPTTFEHCALVWEEESLFVTTQDSEGNRRVPALENETWLKNCLMRSPIRRIYLDPSMAEAVLKAWADIAENTGKEVYLKTPAVSEEMPEVRQPLKWSIKRFADWFMAGTLLILLSPLLLLIAVGVHLDSQGPVFFQQWRVGHCGRLFRIYKFRSMEVNAEARHHEVMGDQEGLHKLERDPRVTRLGYWLRKLSLDELPQLFNVLRGEMSLVGPRPWALCDAVRIPDGLQGRLNALPGITGAWQVSTRSNELDLYAVTCRDLGYLQSWNLLKDLGILLLTIPKVLLGSGAC